MSRSITLFNSLSGEKEKFEPINPGLIGMYVCGPTVYNDVHLGNCRTFVNFDIIYRFLLYAGYKVRYVRNITDVGHLLDDGEDRMSKGARLEKLEPMEVAQKYSNGFHDMMRIFNTLPPSIEPQASGHIPEQIEMVQAILDNGFGYEINGSVYFDTLKFAKEFNAYGKLSGRVIDDLLSETRDNLKNQDEKRHPSDFAIWIKASPEHIMRWKSPWSVGFPGWHLECSAMSTKYLGPTFDIHGGGGDLKFPHHENEIAQNMGACNQAPAKYWMHANMLLLNGKKMSKSDGNTISPVELFDGTGDIINKGFSPMVVRFFMLQAHYRSTLDITEEALVAAQKGYDRLMQAWENIQKLEVTGTAKSDLDVEILSLLDEAIGDMYDDFNTPRALSRLFEIVSKINGLVGGQIDKSQVHPDTLDHLRKTFEAFIFNVFGLKQSIDDSKQLHVIDGLMDLIINLRQNARTNKDWAISDQIRDHLIDLNIQIKDGKGETSWQLN